jgi:hypothetical protein
MQFGWLAAVFSGERPTTTTDLLEAFVRQTSTRRKPGRETSRGKILTIVNAKGGRLVILRPDNNVAKILEIANMDALIPIHQNEVAATAALTT